MRGNSWELPQDISWFRVCEVRYSHVALAHLISRSRFLRLAAARVPLMVHHSFSTVPLEDCPGAMEPGDLYTHMYHGFPSTIIDMDSRRVHRAVRDAQARGVLFDVGHGQGSFSWTVAEICAAEGFWPDTISTDLHIASMNAGMKDMLNVMSKFLNMGVALPDLIERVTVRPARAIKRPELGTLREGGVADIAILELQTGRFGFVDTDRKALRGTRRLNALLTIRNGRVVWDTAGLSRTEWTQAGPYTNYR